MNIRKEYESIKSMITHRDVVNFLISILGIVWAITQIVGIFNEGNKANMTEVIIYNCAVCFIIVFINIYCLKSRSEISKKEEAVKSLEENNKNLLEITDNMRCFKHDFNNIIQAIDGYIYLDDMKSLQVYIKPLVEECHHVNVVDSLNCKKIDNPAIYGILLDKYRIAEKKNIQMNIEVLEGLKQLNERSYVVSRMLGILLDNAIEASNECDEKIVNVQVLKEPSRKRCIIKIENTYENKEIDTDKIFEKNYSTKKGNTGLGLWKIRDILKKDTSLDLFTSKDEEMFKQQIEIYEYN